MPEISDISLSLTSVLPSSDLLPMKDTKTAEVPTVVLNETTIQAIIDNIAATTQIKPTDGASAMPRGRGSGRRPRGLQDVDAFHKQVVVTAL